MIYEITATEEHERLDVFMSEQLEITRTQVQKLINSRHIKSLDKFLLKPSHKVFPGMKFLAEIPESLNLTYLKADPVDFDVVYEDPDIIVVNKPAGLVVHPAPGNWRNTLVNGLVYRYPEMKALQNWLRPGIVHRLDGGTSGLMVVARTQKATMELQAMFKNRKVGKHYIALSQGVPERREGILSGPIDRDPHNMLRRIISENGKPALTGYKVFWSMNGISLVECELFTGRTHQIRVHMSALGCPLVGDTMYGARDEEIGRVYLHSWKLEFSHPVSGEDMKFRLPVTPDFTDYIKKVREAGQSEAETTEEALKDSSEIFDL